MDNMMKRTQFTFYRSYWEAIANLPKKDRLPLYEAITDYALNGTAPQLSTAATAAFILIKPTLDTSRKRAIAGRQGGIKRGME